MLRTRDRSGNRSDRVDYHPGYHRLTEVAVGRGLHATAWAKGSAGFRVARAAAFGVWSQVGAGHGCPISMTYAQVVLLGAQLRPPARGGPGAP